MKHTSQFDKIAVSYYNSVPDIPQQYINLIQRTFNIVPDDKVIDLGCGSGDLIRRLAKKSLNVTGLDSSKIMIKMAQEKDKNNQVKWIHKSVEDFNFGEERYDLILSFESFHLFPSQTKIIKRCAKALKKGGALCIGFRMYSFDIPLRETLEEIFAKHGISYEWGFWTCPEFPTIVSNSNLGLSSLQEKDINVPARVSTENILNFVFNISHSASLKDKIKQNAYEDLKKRILKVYPSGECVGDDQYIIRYCEK